MPDPDRQSPLTSRWLRRLRPGLAGQGGNVRRTVASEFDPVFYAAAYPDAAAPGRDPLSHFIATGWREGRDPNPRFSTADYLARNEDVRRAGVNPLFHYLAYGRREGRIARPSRALEERRVTGSAARAEGGARPGPHPSVLPRAAPQASDRPRRYAVVSLIRNEADIVESFAAHLLEMFDVVLCIDHSSADGTFEYLKRLEKGQPRVAVYRLDEPGYLQAAVTNHLIGAASELQGADWIFLLDADEFLPFATRAEFERAMAGFEDSPVIELPWRNLVPAAYWDYRVDLDADFYVPDAAASHSKVAFQPGRLRPGEFWFEQGNHRVAHCEGGIPVPARTAFHLWHLPVRSHLQLALKVTQGVAAYRAMGDARDAAQGEHWFRLLAQLRANTIGEGHLDRIVCSYGVPGGDLAPLSRKELAARGYRRSRLRIGRAAVEEKAALLDRDGLAALLKDMEERASAERTPETGRPVRRLETQADRVIRRAPGEAGARFPALTAFGDDPLGDDGAVPDHALIRDFLRPTYWEIDYLPPTAWAGHIPFMFAFVSTFRPRRYVELGAHWGASFFAFCQAAERVRLESSAVAIDTWQGDEHAGFYQSGVFDSFVGRLRPYASFASYLRARFDDAAKEFEDGAIDLLHIDGLHTYDAVRHDFETWLPKMSDRGTVLFHDIAVHERDFGVWQFWDELKARYPTLEFRHASGLGAAYVGSAPKTGIERFMRLLAGDAALDSLVQGHLERIAELTAALREAKAAAARSSGELDRLRAAPEKRWRFGIRRR